MGKCLKAGELKKLLEAVDDNCDVIISAYDGQIDEFRHSYVTSIGILDGSKKFEDNDAVSFMTGLNMGVSNTGICKSELYKDERLDDDDVCYVDGLKGV
ncbi:MAG: hypothetical protein J6Y02_12625 [Pseudobutyrivibrio sp.]|nr:hypothetical protein [Pseudobutyrivibrio sp.]